MRQSLLKHRLISVAFTLLGLVLSGTLHAEGDAELMLTIKRHLLSSPSAADTRLVTRTLDFIAPQEHELSDIVAERLYQAAQKGIAEEDEDAVAWYAKSLGELGDARYRDVVTETGKAIKNKKVARELAIAKRHLVDRGAGRYVRGSVDVPLIRQQTQAALSAQRHADNIALSVDALMGRSLAEVISAFGMPDYLGSQEFVLNGVLIVQARTDAVMAHYFGHGIVVFSWDLDRKLWVADKVWLDRSTQGQTYNGSQPLFASILASADGKYFRVALVRARKHVMLDEVLVALLRRRLLASLAETEPHEVAALEYVCTVLAMRPVPENVEALEAVMAGAASEDLRDRAESRLEEAVGERRQPNKAKPRDKKNAVEREPADGSGALGANQEA